VKVERSDSSDEVKVVIRKRQKKKTKGHVKDEDSYQESE
jgi:hypothetical protein